MKKDTFFIILILLLILIYTSNITQLPSRVFLLNGENIQIKKFMGFKLKEQIKKFKKHGKIKI